MKNKVSKIIVLIFAIIFSVAFFMMSNYFFDAFSYQGKFIFVLDNLFYVSLFLLVMAIIFNILLFVFILSNKKVTTKMFFTILPLTLLFIASLYYLVFDVNPSPMVMAVKDNIMTSDNSVIWTIIALSLIYIITMLIVIINVLKPIKRIERAVTELSNGYVNQPIMVSKGKDFSKIEKGLNQINYNFKQDKIMFEKLNDEYSKYLPQQFVKQLGKKSVLDLSLGCNIQKEITSMFIDIRNSTKTSFTLSLADNFNFINKYLGIIGPIVRKYEGFVDKYLGDGVLAIFTSPDIALKCANEIVIKINQDSQKLGLYNIKIGIGIHTGQVVMGVIGEKKRLSATVISDSVNIASYLEKLNSVLGSTVIFTKSTLNNLKKDNPINYRYIGTFEMGHCQEDISVFESLDCYEENIKNYLIKNKPQFENAVRCYELGGDSCKKIFKSCVTKDFNDKVCKYYLKKLSNKS